MLVRILAILVIFYGALILNFQQQLSLVAPSWFWMSITEFDDNAASGMLCMIVGVVLLLLSERYRDPI